MKRNIPGLAVVVVRNDQIVFMEGFGLRDIDQKLPVTSDTPFVIGSCTKAFTAMAAVMSQDDGKLSLDDHPGRFLPYFKLRDTEANSRITIRDLLCHRSGLPYEDDSLWKNRELGREEIIKAGMMAEPTAPLGKKFQYNNVLFTAAGQAVAAAQDSTWEKMITTRIFSPLGMNASMTSQRESAQDHSCAYLPGKPPRKIPIPDYPGLAPAGGISSSVKDLGKWIRLMLAGGIFNGKRLVSAAGFNEITSRQVRLTHPSSKLANFVISFQKIFLRRSHYYGLGWQIEGRGKNNILYHAGGIKGFTALVYLIPHQERGFAILMNVLDTNAIQAMMRIILKSDL